MPCTQRNESSTSRDRTERFLVVREVAEELRTSPSWVYGQIRARRFPATFVGSRVVVRRDDLDRWIEAQRFSAEQVLDARVDARFEQDPSGAPDGAKP